MANLTTLSSGSSATLTVTEGQSIVLNNGRSDVARLQIDTGPNAGRVVTAFHNGRREYGPFGAGTITISAVSGDLRYELSGDTVSPLDDDGQPLTATENQTVRALVLQSWNETAGWRVPRILKDSFTKYDLTGGSVTVGTEYELLAVDLPDGCLLDYGAGIIIEAAWNYTNNTNGKRFRVALGTSSASVQSLWEKTRTNSAQGQESTYIHLKRSTLSTTGCMTFGNNGVTAYGQTPPGTTTDPISTNTVDPALTGLKLFFLGTLQTANTDLIRLCSVRVTLTQAEA